MDRQANPVSGPLEHMPQCGREWAAPILCLALLLWGTLARADSRLTCTAGPGALASAASALYPQPIVFDVYRKGEAIGTHRTRFERRDGFLEVHSRLELRIRFWFVEAFHYHYQSVERWCGDRLVQLEATVDDNGQTSQVRAEATADGLLLRGIDGSTTRVPPLFPTTHWHAGVLNAGMVLNTLTGHPNHITLRACLSPPPDNGPAARCYDYTGDLSARVWYDATGRWRGLAFTARDGSRLEYRAGLTTRATRDDPAREPQT